MQYKITVKEGWMGKLIAELQAWGVSPSKYTIIGGGVIHTKDSNVVDVATETFINAPPLITVEKVQNDAALASWDASQAGETSNG